MDRGPISEYRHVARINKTRLVSPSLLGLLSCALRWYRCILAEHGGIHKGPLPAVMLDLCGRPLSWIHTWGRGGGTNGQPARTVKAMEKRHGMPYSRSPKNPTLQQLQESSKSALTVRPRRGRFGTLLGQLQCGIFQKTAVPGVRRLMCHLDFQKYEQLWLGRARTSSGTWKK